MQYRRQDQDTLVEVHDPPRGPVLVGKLEIKPDGTHHFTDARTGGTWVRKPNGQITISDSNGRVINEISPPPRR